MTTSFATTINASDYAAFANSAYKDRPLPENLRSQWTVCYEYTPPNSSGFQAVAYKNINTNEIVIAFRGTDSVIDKVITDGQIFLGSSVNQYSP